jgi:hypothetical protein
VRRHLNPDQLPGAQRNVASSEQNKTGVCGKTRLASPCGVDLDQCQTLQKSKIYRVSQEVVYEGDPHAACAAPQSVT